MFFFCNVTIEDACCINCTYTSICLDYIFIVIYCYYSVLYQITLLYIYMYMLFILRWFVLFCFSNLQFLVFI